MRSTLAARLILWIGLPAMLLFVLVVAISSSRSREHVMRETEMSTRNLALYHAERIDNTLTTAAAIAEMVAGEMELSPKGDELALNEYLRGVVRRNYGRIYGSCIAFEPYLFSPQRELLAPYYYWKGGRPEYVQLGNAAYNYPAWEWYRAPIQAGAPWWTEPYFDEGGGETIMTTYSVPFRRNGKIWGVATIDIAMNALTDAVETVKIGKRGYAFVLSKAGRFLSFPDHSKLMSGSLFDLDPTLATRMTSGESGFIHALGPLRRGPAWIAFTPIKTGGLSLAVVTPAEEVMAGVLKLQRELMLLGGIGLLAIGAVLVLIVRSISKPIAELALAAQRVAGGDLDLQLAQRTRTLEVSNLTSAFQKMMGDLKTRMNELRAATAAKERVEGEMEAARTIQMSLLPQKDEHAARPEFDVAAQMLPAREVGGDFYDYFYVDREWFCVLIGDVAGKGVPAALYMAVTTTLVRAHSRGNLSPARVLRRVNLELCAKQQTGMFVSLFCAVLHIPSGMFVWSNAGHNPPILISEGALQTLSHEAAVVLGASDKAQYENVEMHLKPGDTLFCYTDGVTEATRPDGSFYGVERLETFLRQQHKRTPADLGAMALRDVSDFAGAAPRADDITLLVLRYAGAKPV